MAYDHYSYDDYDEHTVSNLDKAEMYWRGRDDGRLEAGGGLPTFLGGFFIGATAITIIWIMVTLWR